MKKIVFSLCVILLWQTGLLAQDHTTEKDYLKNKTGRWSVVMTLRPSANAAPIVA